MKFYLGVSDNFEAEIQILKAVKRLDERTFSRRTLCRNHGLSVAQLAAASVLQFAPQSSAFNYLNKGIVERIQGEYLSEHDMLRAARALGLPVKDSHLGISKSFIKALEAVQRLGCVLEFPAAQEE